MTAPEYGSGVLSTLVVAIAAPLCDPPPGYDRTYAVEAADAD